MSNLQKIGKELFITSDEEIKDGDWMIRNNEQPIKVTVDFFWDFKVRYYKIILTTDSGLIKDGVQAIDDEFLEWFVKNPSCERVEIKSEYLDSKCLKCGFIENHDEVDTEYCPKCENHTYEHLYNHNKIIIPKEETLKEVGDRELSFIADFLSNNVDFVTGFRTGMVLGVKWEQQNSNINALDFEIDSLKREIKVLKHQQEKLCDSEVIQRIRATLSDAEARRLIFETFKNK